MFLHTGTECKVESALKQVIELGQWLTRAAASGTAEHEVERHLFKEMLAMGAKLLGEFFTSVGPCDLGQTVTLKNGGVLKRLPEQQARRLVTVFGEFSIPRFVYGSRPGQKIEAMPTDQRLQLPDSEMSYLLQDWNQMMSVEQPFGTVAKSLQTILGLKQSVDTLEHGNQQMAETAAAFRAAQPRPDPKAEGELLVTSEDNKGVPMVRPVEAAPVGAHLKKGEKANKKQMACIGVVYTVDRQVRTPEELVAALFRDPGNPRDHPPPEACQKRYWAELTREVAGEMVRAQDEVFKHLRDEVKQRRKEGQILVHLSDGQTSLEEDRKKYLPRDRKTVDILDLLHANPRLWEAAHLFHAEGSDEATAFVRKQMLLVLKGKAKGVIDDLRQTGTKLPRAKAARLRKLCKFLEKNLHRMHYGRYLRAGYPIATGVIEGACRHVIKDRMERAGMRWKIPGAEAMLELRTIETNGDWDALQNYRIDHENKRLYPYAEIIAAAA
jgi:hypothetical protein